MIAPTQAVILCGGLGNRLRPLTDTLPKPMAPVNGRPFLAFLIEQLRDQGIHQIILLTGYRGDMIREYFGDGASFGVQIEYSHGPVEWETGRRFWEARGRYDEHFVLLYSDNFVPFSLRKLATIHNERQRAITLTVAPKSAGNIRLGASGDVEQYDASRTAAELDYVEIGYMIVERSAVLAALTEHDASFSRVIESLANEHRTTAHVTRDAYHSISDPQRLRLTERYLAPKRILLIDRDGTINARPPRAAYVGSWEQFQWVDDTVDAMRRLAVEGFSFVVISNQAGIARGLVTRVAVDAINHRMTRELASCGIEIMDVVLCPHHWDDGCACRKPAPGLLFEVSRTHQLRMDRTVYIGDDPRDARAAHNAECLSVLIGPERDHDPGGGATPAFTAQTLGEAVPWIVAQFERWEAAIARPALPTFAATLK